MRNGIPDKAKIDLHVHPYLENYPIQDLISAAEKNGINILGLERYKDDVFPEISKKARQLPKEEYDVRRDNGTCIAVYNKETKKTTYILRATEIMTGDRNGNENFHFLGIGDISGLDIRKEKPFPKTEKCIESIIKNESIAIIDHPYADADHEYKSITKDKEKELESICNEFKRDITLEWNSYCIPSLRLPLEFISSLTNGDLTGYDVNKNAEKLAKRLSEHKIRIVADSDVHARNMGLLEGIGAGHIEIFKERMDYSSGKNIIKSIKNAIKIGELKDKERTAKGYNFGYENIKNYVSISHFVEAFGVPAVLRMRQRRG